MSDPRDTRFPMSRRGFLSGLAGASGALIAGRAVAGARFLRPLSVDNPLSAYPNRDWEKVYRDLYKSDSSFVFLCAPNDTHNCLLRAHVKNGVITRVAPSYRYKDATDLEGNRASARWDPRCCQKGLALPRRIYGDRRCKRPMIRRGFKRWADDGFPRDPRTGAADPRYFERATDDWVAVSWDEAFNLTADALVDIARTYGGTEGQERLLAQDYDPVMVEATQGAGTQVLKFRGGMPPLGITRIYAQNRLANNLALLDDTLRGTGREGALGARGWDSYTWHTDLPPGHPMVTGQQTMDFDLCAVEHADLILVWGMNWITTKMPDGHWLTEARMKGSRVIGIWAEYSATANKADDVLVVRPGTTPALALGFAQVILAEGLYDEEHVKANTDLPYLVRLDTGELLRAGDVFPGYRNATLTHNTTIVRTGAAGPAIHQQQGPVIAEAMRESWGDHVVWDRAKGAPAAVNRDLIGARFTETGVDAALEGRFEVTLADGAKVPCVTVLQANRDVIDASYTPEQVEQLTWAPAEAVRAIAREIAANPERTLFAMGMGPNQYFNNDLKDRAVFLVAALTRNIGHLGGNVGSYAGNYRASFFNGLAQFIAEDPFDVELNPNRPARTRGYYKMESAHYFNSGDRILRMGKSVLTGKTHTPTPTKAILMSNSNSLVGNTKGHYEQVLNTHKRVELIVTNEWWWTATCEHSDVVFPVDSWAEFRFPDMTMSVTNPFLYVFPTSPLPRIHDTRSDLEVAAGIAKAVGQATGDRRYDNYWRFVEQGQARPYIQRILDHSNATRGYRIEDLEAKAAEGIPAIIQTRTYPKYAGFEQTVEGKPWYTKTGRLEFYREEPEFRDSGENLILHREPIDSTFYEPNVIVAVAHPLLRPKRPEDYGVSRDALDGDTRQARHVVKTVEELLASHHPLAASGYHYIFHTPKYRHGTHTTPADTDIVAIWFGPFGDMHRHDRRTPFITEMYVDINPADGQELGVEDGDYVWIDADPADRPFRGWQRRPKEYAFARLLVRARYYPGTPRGVTRMWHNAYGTTPGSFRGAMENPTGLAKSPTTGYQSMFRGGSHQSCTRGYLKPTLMTDSLVVKTVLGQQITQGFVADVHCTTGAPREAKVRIERAEAGGIGGEGLWLPARLGLRPGYESAALKRYIAGDFIDIG